jgi:hypothetical protein
VMIFNLISSTCIKRNFSAAEKNPISCDCATGRFHCAATVSSYSVDRLWRNFVSVARMHVSPRSSCPHIHFCVHVWLNCTHDTYVLPLLLHRRPFIIVPISSVVFTYVNARYGLSVYGRIEEWRFADTSPSITIALFGEWVSGLYGGSVGKTARELVPKACPTHWMPAVKVRNKSLIFNSVSPFDWRSVRWPHWIFFLFGATAPQWAMASSFTRFLDHTQRRTTVVRTPLDEWSARRRDLYQTSMPRWESNPQSQQTSGRRPTP